jgi:hypothetical protein
MKKQTLSALLLIAAITFYRLVITLHPHASWLENFAPVAAIALCGGIFLPRPLAFAVPLGSLLISDFFLDRHYHSPYLTADLLIRLLAFTTIVAIGLLVRQRPRLLTILPAALGASILLYIVTNTSAWLASPAYAKSLTGWFQALTFGIPGFPPTWTFFRSSLISDLLFTSLFFLCIHPSAASASEIAEPDFHPALQKR